MKVNGNNNANGVNTNIAETTLPIKEWLTRHQHDLEVALPKNTVKIDRFMQSSLLAIYDSKNPLVAKCSVESIYKSLRESANLGLEVGGILGQAYLIPYNEYNKSTGTKVMTCHFQMGYKGLIALARRSETIKTIAAEAVHRNDIFECQLGMNRNLSHKINIFEERGDIVAYYCLVELVNGGSQFIVMSKKEIEKHRDSFSKNYNSSDPNNVWNKNFDAMALKTCIIQALKLCPISVEALEAVRAEEAKEAGEPMQEMTEATTFTPDGATDVAYTINDEMKESNQQPVNNVVVEPQQPVQPVQEPKKEPAKNVNKQSAPIGFNPIQEQEQQQEFYDYYDDDGLNDAFNLFNS